VAISGSRTADTELGVACDLVALSMMLAIGLLFSMHVVERMEGDMISAVDARVSAELVGRFEPAFHPASNPQVAVLQRMSEELMKAMEQTVERQAAVWRASFTQTQKQWHDWSLEATANLRDALARTMQDHAATVSAAANASTQKWSEIQQALLQNAEAVTLQQRELVRQNEVLAEVVAATGQVEKLETELNRNLSTLAGAKNFEQTVLSLGAAIQLLNSKLGPETPQVQLKAKRASKAA
jgi:hypothetical protein